MVRMNLPHLPQIQRILAPPVALVLAMLLPASPAAADSPLVTWDSANPQVSIFTRGNVTRALTWTCDDPNDDFPLELRCEVYDITLGPHGSGKEVKLSDTVCGKGSKDPIQVPHTYQVASAQKDHRYMYVARCRDAKKYDSMASILFWYDLTLPSSVIHSGPPKKSSSSTVTFVVSCADNSFSYKTPPPTFGAACDNYTSVTNTDTGVLAKPLSMSGSSTSAGMKITIAYTYLPPGNYRFETYAKDQAGNKGLSQFWTWGVAGPDGGPPDAAVLVDHGPPPDKATPDLAAAADKAGVGHDGSGQDGPGQDGPGQDGPGQDMNWDAAAAGEGGAGKDLKAGADKGHADAGAQDEGAGHETGCDCRAGGGAASSPALLGVLALLLAASRRRRNG